MTDSDTKLLRDWAAIKWMVAVFGVVFLIFVGWLVRSTITTELKVSTLESDVRDLNAWRLDTDRRDRQLDVNLARIMLQLDRLEQSSEDRP